jgi:transcriptional regulator with XRE-family HTH domain
MSKFRNWRRRAGLSLSEVSGITGASVPMLSLIENGLRSPSPEMKVTIARRLHVPVERLFEVEEIDELKVGR